MSTFSKTTFPIAVLAAILAPASAQEQQQGDAKSKPEYTSISKVVGAKVLMNASANAKRDADRNAEPADQPSGKLQDVLVDAESGKLDFAVVSFGGFAGIGEKTVAVPFSAMTWNEAHERFELAANEDRLKALPEFDVDKSRKGNIDEARNVAQQHWRTNEGATPSGETRPSGERPNGERPSGETRQDGQTRPNGEGMEQKPLEPKAIAGTKFFTLPTRFVYVSELDDYSVYATGEKVGSLGEMFIDRGQSAITLVVVERGGTLGVGGKEYLIPFRAIRLGTSGEEKVLALNCAPKDLETAVRYEKPKNGVIDVEAAKRALESDRFAKHDANGRVSQNR